MRYIQSDLQELEKDYPYLGMDGKCKFSKSSGRVQVSKINDVAPDSVSQLKAAIAKGPTSVTVEADQIAFQHYQQGILDADSCGTNLDHAVTAVGYGEENGQEFYIVRNSWGADWGEDGYIRIAAKPGQDGKGICGIQ
jgi:C1A family cysteine protease